MMLETQIKLIDNPQTFTQLFNMLMSAEHAGDFQPINDARADGGNDGYLRSEKRLFARHCFKKTEKQRDDQAILRKMRSDFAKAVKLKASREYEIEHWSFVTNYPISEKVFAQVAKLSAEHGISINFPGPEMICTLATKHQEVLVGFPELEQIFIKQDIKDVSKKIDKLADLVSENNATPTEENITPTDEEIPKIEVSAKVDMSHPDVLRAIELNKPDVTSEEKSEIKAMIYSTESDSARLQAVFSLTQMYNPLTDDPQDWIDMIDIAITTATTNNWPQDLAVLQAEKGSYITHQQIPLQINYWGMLAFRRDLGEWVISNEELEQTSKKIEEYDQQRREVLAAALDTAQKANDWETYGFVLLNAGQSAGSIAGVLNKMGDTERAKANLKLARQTLTESKNCFDRAGDKVKRVYALHNLANQIRFFDSEKDTALIITRQVIKESKALKQTGLLKRAQMLEQHIITGEIPDYVGEHEKNLDVNNADDL